MPNMIPVRTSAGHVRYVTANQTAGEIAGRVLPPSATLWRTAVKVPHPIYGSCWLAYYVTPKKAQVEAWENRPRNTNHSIQREFAH